MTIDELYERIRVLEAAHRRLIDRVNDHEDRWRLATDLMQAMLEWRKEVGRLRSAGGTL